MTIIFKAKTNDGYVIKCMAEVLAHNIKTACFEIDAEGIHLCTTDHHKTVLVNTFIDAKQITYKFAPSNSVRYFDSTTNKMYLGITMSHFYKMLNPIKKKDSLELFIDDQQPMLLQIRVISKDNKNNHNSVSTVTIQAIRDIQPEVPNNGYGKCINIPPSDYQKMIKSMAKISNSTTITCIGGSKVGFRCSQEGIGNRFDEFGDEPEEEENEEFKADYSTELLCRISKIAGLSSNLQLFTGSPLKFKSSIGVIQTIGYMEFFIKSNLEIEEDKRAIEELDYDSE